jgi:hypothetical protein
MGTLKANQDTPFCFAWNTAALGFRYPLELIPPPRETRESRISWN